MEEIELNDKEEDKDDRDEDSRNSYGSDDLRGGLNWLSSGVRVTRNEKTINKIFNGRASKYYHAVEIFDTLLIMKNVKNPKFIKYIIDNHEFSVKRIVSISGNEYEVSYYGKPYVNDNNVSVRPFHRFKRNGDLIENPDEMN